jgi:hypothetical protein
MELNERVTTIRTREDLVAFIHVLRDDFVATPAGWENPDVERYLEALAAWTSDMEGYFKNRGERIPDVPTWRLVAEMLLAAKYYE